MNNGKVLDAQFVEGTTEPEPLRIGEPDVINFEEDAGKGNEHVGIKDLKTQYLAIVEGQSACLKRNNGAYIKEAQQGMIVNSVTRELYDGEQGIMAVTCHYYKEVVEWDDKRVVARYPLDHPVVAAKFMAPNAQGRMVLTNKESGFPLVETAYHSVLQIDTKTLDAKRVVIGMASTKLKKSAALNTLVDGKTMTRKDGTVYQAPRFAQIYKMFVVSESNKLGDFFNWDASFVGFVPSKALYEKAKAYHEEVEKNGVKLPEVDPDENDAKEPADGDVAF